MQQASEKKSAKAKDLGKNFLENNKKNEGVIVTASGLQYKVLTQGTGKMPTPNSNVTVHYTGKLIDGTVFDSSVQRGTPADFGVTQVIRGWTEALQLMKEGDKWILYIPYDLAYGERGAGGSIPPYSALIFEVELIKVNN
jgi:FKBP-type peptidyl-prolyl cis-trans isomerase FklB